VVERILGKAEVPSSILGDGTIFRTGLAHAMSAKKPPPNPRDARLAEALKRNIQRRKAAKKPPKPKG
jgi:hypothetical protein